MRESTRTSMLSAAMRSGLALSMVAGCQTNDVALGGPDTVVRVDPEAAGAHCEDGGVAIRSGLDDDGDLYLDDDEIDTTQYACNGWAPVQCSGGTIAPGPLVIGSDADWQTLAGVHCVDGDLLITGLAAAPDDLPDLSVVTGDLVVVSNPGLPSLAALGHVKYVAGPVLIQSNAALVSLEGLGALERADAIRVIGNNAMTDLEGLGHLRHFGGELQIENNGALTSLSGLDNLISAGVVAIRSNRQLATLAALAALKSVAQLEISGHPALPAVSLPALERSEFRLIVQDNPATTDLAAAALVAAGSSVVIEGNALTRVDLGSLVTAGAVFVRRENALATLSMPRLAYVTGPLELSYLPAVTRVAFGALTSTAGRLYVELVPRLTSFAGLDKLEAIGGDLIVRSDTGLVSFEGLGALRLVGGDMLVQDNTALSSLAGLAAMTEIGGALTVANNPRLSAAAVEAFRNRVQVGH